MKRLTAFLPFFLFLFPVFSQCPSGNLLITTQAEIDSFSVNYPGCTITFNSIEIKGGSSITNLQGLSQLTKLGDLTIENNPNLTSLSGLDNLQSTIGFFLKNNDSITDFSGLENFEFADDLVIDNNNMLTSLHGLQNFQSTYVLEIRNNPILTSLDELDSLGSANQVIIWGNGMLTSLTGLEKLTSLSILDINSNPNLQNLNGLDNLTETGFFLIIDNNVNLTDISALSNVSKVNDLYLLGNNRLKNVSGFDNLTLLRGDLYIAGNDSLVDLTAFSNLVSLDTINGSELRINQNNSLETLAGLDNIDPTSISNLIIEQNMNLTTCEVQSVCDYLSIPASVASIFSNKTGCDTRPEVDMACSPNLCPNSAILFTTQTQIDSFPINFPSCTVMDYDIDIIESTPGNITNLLGLAQLQEIHGTLNIQGNSSLDSLTGLGSVKLINTIKIENNSGLESLAGLDSLESVDSLAIMSNNNLTQLDGLDSINSTTLSHLIIKDNDLLSSCAIQSVCDYLDMPANTTDIQNNNTGCDTRTEVEAVCNGTSSIQNDFGSALVAYPNPTKKDVFIELGDVYNQIQVEVRNVIGQRVWAQMFQQTNQLSLELPQSAGLYFIRIKTRDGKNAVIKVMKII